MHSIMWVSLIQSVESLDITKSWILLLDGLQSGVSALLGSTAAWYSFFFQTPAGTWSADLGLASFHNHMNQLFITNLFLYTKCYLFLENSNIVIHAFQRSATSHLLSLTIICKYMDYKCFLCHHVYILLQI